jgi:hypothetical protein
MFEDWGKIERIWKEFSNKYASKFQETQDYLLFANNNEYSCSEKYQGFDIKYFGRLYKGSYIGSFIKVFVGVNSEHYFKASKNILNNIIYNQNIKIKGNLIPSFSNELRLRLRKFFKENKRLSYFSYLSLEKEFDNNINQEITRITFKAPMPIEIEEIQKIRNFTIEMTEFLKKNNVIL